MRVSSDFRRIMETPIPGPLINGHRAKLQGGSIRYFDPFEVLDDLWGYRATKVIMFVSGSFTWDSFFERGVECTLTEALSHSPLHTLLENGLTS